MSDVSLAVLPRLDRPSFCGSERPQGGGGAAVGESR